jgi:phage shock protein PspC (stress-responsive transcriptional regulator)
MSQLDRHGSRAPAKFRLDRTDGKVFGVCAGLANYMNVDPMIVRLVFVAGTIFGFGSFVIIYLAIALLAD